MQVPFSTVCAASLLLLAWPAFPQQRDYTDCSSPASFDDPRCQAMARPSEQQPSRDYSPALRIPVIRDQSLPPLDNGLPEQQSPTGRPFPAVPLPLPPEQPTEFQKFVEQATGKPLALFGANLFRDVPSTFAPVDRVAVTPEYAVGPGDQLLIRAWGQIDLNVSPVVDRSGAVYIPRVGEVTLAGLKFDQVREYLKTSIGRVYHNFDLSVSMGQLRSMQVFVVGHVRHPGVYTISSLSTLVNAVFTSGGPSSQGSMRDIQLRRYGKTLAEFDLYDLLLHGDKSNDRPLLPGDVIYIPPVGPQVALAGSLNAPAIYELKGEATLRDALQLAGGLTPVAARRNAVIERIEGGSRQILNVPLDAQDASAARLQNGDVVNILAIVPRFANTVTLRGNVADPIRVPWQPGMRIRDLIPDRDALLTRDYWRMRNRLLSTRPPAERADRQNPSTPAVEDAVLDPREETADDKNQPENPPLIARTSAEPLAGRLAASRTPARVGTPGSIANTGTSSPPAKNRVERNPLEVNWAYAVIERRDPQNLSTSLVPFRLGKAIIDRDEKENLPLEPGDVVTIFSTSDIKVPQTMQTRFVRLEGEFASAGVYSVRAGETLRQLVQRAGGLTPQAYLFGSEFRRDSSRLEQQQRLDDLTSALERQVASSAANVRGTVISPEEAVAATSQIDGQRELVQKLRQVRATGRIVLDLDPRVPGADSLPDMPLEDGDVFEVPSRPSFINVVGSVNNGTSFLYVADKRLGDYLRESGGPTRTGDSRHAFLIRADGSVVSKTWSSGLLSQSFEGLRLNPGDSIVVPEQINKTTFLKGLKDWSQVFAQFALGAAAINILR